MKYRSVCTGIAAETVAWHPLGWLPLSFAEIEPFCCALLKHRYPEVQNYGDFTKQTYGEGTTDILMGGTPCQSFSVAGRRGGLDDARGNLALEFVRLAQRLRARWVVWENVKGVLSSDGGEAFGSFLGALAECGYGFSYRVLNAQFDGLAQRRERVFVVGYLGDWRPPAAVLFERESLRRDTAPSREAGQEVAGTIGGRAGEGGFRNNLDNHGAYVGFHGAQITSKRNRSQPSEQAPALNGDPRLATYFNLDSRTKIDNDVARVLKSDTGSGGRGCVFSMDLANQGYGGNRGYGFEDEPCTTLGTSGDKGVSINAAVRRLTPMEWERLMGLPDGYTDIPYRKKKAADGPRYRAIGNSISVPTLRWIGQRIDMVERIMAEHGASPVLQSLHGKETNQGG